MNSSVEIGVRAGVDLGGTGVRIALLKDLKEVAASTIPTASFGVLQQSERLRRLAEIILEMMPTETSLLSVGIGASGPVDTKHGIIDNDDTLAAFSHLPIVRSISERLAVPVRIDNDAITAAIGEYHAGAGIGCHRLLMVTLGTGIGVALLNDGQPFRTAAGSHPEGGHISVATGGRRCYCGLTGCWEMTGSRTWLQAELLKMLPEARYEQQDLGFFRDEAERNHQLACLFRQYGNNIGRGLNSLMTLYGPDLVVLSGSAAKFYPLFRVGLEEVVRRSAGFSSEAAIVPSTLGDAGGAIGAALLHNIPESRQQAACQQDDLSNERLPVKRF